MSGFLELALALIFLPMLGAAVLGVAGAVCHVATAPTTPGWQSYLWYLATAVVVFELAGVLGAKRFEQKRAKAPERDALRSPPAVMVLVS